MAKQENLLHEVTDKIAISFMFLVVLLPGVATASFTAPFDESMNYHFSG
jgi:hypothetical protein